MCPCVVHACRAGGGGRDSPIGEGEVLRSFGLLSGGLRPGFVPGLVIWLGYLAWLFGSVLWLGSIARFYGSVYGSVLWPSDPAQLPGFTNPAAILIVRARMLALKKKDSTDCASAVFRIDEPRSAMSEVCEATAIVNEK